jgi:hypothetical protein
MSAAADNPGPRCVLWHPPGVQLPGDLLNSLSRRIGRMALCSDPFTVMAELCANEGTDDSTKPATALLLAFPERLSDLPEVLSEIRTYAPHAVCWKYDERANPRLAAVVETDVTAWLARGASAAAGAGTSQSQVTTTHRSEQRNPSSVSSSPLAPAAIPRSAPASSPAASPAAAMRPPLRLTTDDEPPRTGRPAAPEVVVRPQPERITPPSRQGPPPLTLRGEGPAHPDGASAPPPRPVLTPEEMRMLLGDDPLDLTPRPGGLSNGHHPKPTSGRSEPGGEPR